MITLYGAMASRAHRVVWMLKELDLPFEHVPTNFMDDSTHQPEFLAANPNGRVPALDDDGFHLCESLAINLYQARKYGGPLAPQSSKEEALATQWSFRVTTEVEKLRLLACANRTLFAATSRNEEEAQMALAKLGSADEGAGRAPDRATVLAGRALHRGRPQRRYGDRSCPPGAASRWRRGHACKPGTRAVWSGRPPPTGRT